MGVEGGTQSGRTSPVLAWKGKGKLENSDPPEDLGLGLLLSPPGLLAPRVKRQMVNWSLGGWIPGWDMENKD